MGTGQSLLFVGLLSLGLLASWPSQARSICSGQNQPGEQLVSQVEGLGAELLASAGPTVCATEPAQRLERVLRELDPAENSVNLRFHHITQLGGGPIRIQSGKRKSNFYWRTNQDQGDRSRRVCTIKTRRRVVQDVVIDADVRLPIGRVSIDRKLGWVPRFDAYYHCGGRVHPYEVKFEINHPIIESITCVHEYKCPASISELLAEMPQLELSEEIRSRILSQNQCTISIK